MEKVIFLTLLLCLASFRHVTASGDNHAAAGLLNEALSNMGKATSYHAKAELTVRNPQDGGSPKAHIEGDFGAGVLAYTVVGFDAKETKIVVIGSDTYATTDGGKTWHKNVNRDVAALSQIIVGPVDPRLKLADQGVVKTIGPENVAGALTTRLQVAAKSPVDVWIADDPRAGKVVRKIRLMTTSDDGIDFDTTVVYGDFNKRLDIKAPPIDNR